MNVSSEGIAYLAGYDEAATLHSYTSKHELIEAIYILFSEWKQYTDVATRTVFDEMAWIAGAYDAVGFSLIRLKPVLAIPAGFGDKLGGAFIGNHGLFVCGTLTDFLVSGLHRKNVL